MNLSQFVRRRRLFHQCQNQFSSIAHEPHASSSPVILVEHPKELILWSCLEEIERKAKLESYGISVQTSKDDSLSSFPFREDIRFPMDVDNKIVESENLPQLDSFWKHQVQHASQKPQLSTLLARSLAISKLANTKQELCRSLGAFQRVKFHSSSSFPLYTTLALNRLLLTFFHQPKQVFTLLKENTHFANERSFAISLSSFIRVDHRQPQSAYFLEKALANFPNPSPTNVGSVFELMVKHNVSLTSSLLEDVLINCEADIPIVTLLRNAIPELLSRNSLMYVCRLYEAAYVNINPGEIFQLLGEMEEHNVVCSEYHYLLAMSGIRRRSKMDWHRTPESSYESFNCVLKSPNRLSHNKRVYGDQISPFHIQTIQDAYQSLPQEQHKHMAHFNRDLLLSYATQIGTEPFGASEEGLTALLQDVMTKNLPLEDDAVLWEYVIERLVRNAQFPLLFQLFHFYLPTRSHLQVGTPLVNALLFSILMKLRLSPKWKHTELLKQAEGLVLLLAKHNAPLLLDILSKDKKDSIGVRMQVFGGVDQRTIALLGACYRFAEARHKLSEMENVVSVEFPTMSKRLQDFQLQLLRGSSAIEFVGDLQIKGKVVNEDTIHTLIQVLAEDFQTNEDLFGEAVGNLIGLCRTYKLKPLNKTIRLLVAQSGRLENRNLETLGYLKEYCRETGLEAVSHF